MVLFQVDSRFKNIIINPLIALGLVEMTIPDKPNREGNHSQKRKNGQTSEGDCPGGSLWYAVQD